MQYFICFVYLTADMALFACSARNTQSGPQSVPVVEKKDVLTEKHDSYQRRGVLVPIGATLEEVTNILGSKYDIVGHGPGAFDLIFESVGTVVSFNEFGRVIGQRALGNEPKMVNVK